MNSASELFRNMFLKKSLRDYELFHNASLKKFLSGYELFHNASLKKFLSDYANSILPHIVHQWQATAKNLHGYFDSPVTVQLSNVHKCLEKAISKVILIHIRAAHGWFSSKKSYKL